MTIARYFIIAIFLLSPSAAARQGGAITGRVVADDGEGVANVTVYLNVVGARSGGPRTTATDENGKFRFSDLDQHEYTISVGDFGGYVRTPPSEAERQRSRYYRIGDDVTMTMTRGGVITGRVTNANGEPVIAVAVTAVYVRDTEGAPARGGYPSRPRFTNDRGVYRIYGLTPGTYVVAANRRDNNFRPSPAPYDDELPAYHPAAATRAQATEIKVSAGVEITGVDIRYIGTGGHAIRGLVSGGKGIVTRPAVSVQLFGAQGELSANSAYIRPGDDNRGFAFYGLPDGEYTLNARSVGDDQGLAAAPARITLSGADVAGIELKLDPLGSVSGRIVIDGLPNSCDAKRKISAERTSMVLMRDDLRADVPPFLRYSGISNQRVDENGRFTINRFDPGHYRIVARPLDEYLYVKAITASAATPARRGAARGANPAGGVSQNGFTFRLGEKMAGVTVTVAEGAASLRGKVAPENEGARLPSRLRLHLIPADPKAAEDVLRYSETIVRSEGAFAFNNIAPGKYRLLTRVVPDDEPIDRPPLPAAWDANERANLRKEAVAM
ncbi:MAG TPA: carboxypeptidase-like regulatory domain-containing protein, partial [Blastocatellia bacterium]|nr:carboxypeptidase-like regulatory domain-containing protein [Blastocatellia bacterium]